MRPYKEVDEQTHEGEPDSRYPRIEHEAVVYQHLSFTGNTLPAGIGLKIRLLLQCLELGLGL